MQPLRNLGPVDQTGIILDVDVVGRELNIFSNGTAHAFDVPKACSILLNGEPVKLRLLLPGDYARIAYDHVGERLVARSIRVNWWLPLSEKSRDLRETRAAVRNPGILVAAGMGLILVLLKLEFNLLGFTVWLAQDGEEALRLYRRHLEDIDLVLLDGELPGWGGSRTFAALQQVNPEVSVCLLTDGPAKFLDDGLLELGPAGVLPMKVWQGEFAQAVQQLLAERKRETHVQQERDCPQRVAL